jgi:hypothetical protein
LRGRASRGINNRADDAVEDDADDKEKNPLIEPRLKF